MKKRKVSVITNLVLVIGLLNVGVTAYANTHDAGELYVDTTGSAITNYYQKEKYYQVHESSYAHATFLDIICRDNGTRLYTPQKVGLTCDRSSVDCRLDASSNNSTTGLTVECKDPGVMYVEEVVCDPTKEITAQSATLKLSNNCE